MEDRAENNARLGSEPGCLPRRAHCFLDVVTYKMKIMLLVLPTLKGGHETHIS